MSVVFKLLINGNMKQKIMKKNNLLVVDYILVGNIQKELFFNIINFTNL